MLSCKEYVKREKEELAKYIKAHSNHKWRLDIFQINDDPASNSYVRGKIRDCTEVGIEANLHKYSKDSLLGYMLEDKVRDVSKQIMDEYVHGGIIIQLPVPKSIRPSRILNIALLDKSQDVDGFVSSCCDPCTPRGIMDWLCANDYSLEGKNVVIIGRSEIVGRPLAHMMQKANATVTLCHSYTSKTDLENFCRLADVIVVAVGKPKFLDFDLPKKPLIIDVGINRDSEGKLCGDVNYEKMTNQGCYVTPVPGGVGLLTRLALLKNVVEL